MSKRRIHESDSEEEIAEESFSTINSEEFEASMLESDDFVTDVIEDEIHEDEVELVQGEPLILEAAPLTEVQREVLKKGLIEHLNAMPKYVKEIRGMCTANKESIQIEYTDLEPFHGYIESVPEGFLEVLDEAVFGVVKMYFPNYSLIRPSVHGRIIGLPVTESLRDLRNSHLGKIVSVKGIVTRRSGVFSQYSVIKFTCMKCQAIFGPFIGKDVKPTACFECQSRGPFMVNTSETLYKDFQRATLQEIPGSVPPGTLPRSKDVLFYDDLIDSCRPGDEVEVIGVYKNSLGLGFSSNSIPTFSTVLEASSLVRRDTQYDHSIKFNEAELRKLAENPNIIDILVSSTAPSIFGHRDTKLCLLLAMVGGEPKERDGLRIRGDINVLLMGDPGTAKSQLLRYVFKVSPRAVMATGQGSSGVGLTASVKRNPMLREWVLEGGALVLADNGICCIDEFDKMNETDRVSIHEAMEQQSISISKAGIVASLHARCAVVAAANPVRGAYNSSLSFSQNVNLSDPILSRFDLLCVIKDIIDISEDSEMAAFILSSHSLKAQSSVLSHETLKAYIALAKSIRPVVSSIDIQKISQLYSELRSESASSGVPVTVRQVESIVRIAEAFAKLRLSETVSSQDIDSAISVSLISFLGAQKASIASQMRRKFSRYFDENSDDLALYILKKMVAERLAAVVPSSDVSLREFIARCRNTGLKVAERFFTSERFSKEGFSLHNGIIVRNLQD